MVAGQSSREARLIRLKWKVLVVEVEVVMVVAAESGGGTGKDGRRVGDRIGVASI